MSKFNMNFGDSNITEDGILQLPPDKIKTFKIGVSENEQFIELPIVDSRDIER